MNDFLTPIGRIVQGSLWEPQTKDAEGKPLIIKNGPNAGQPRVDYYMALAIEKHNPGWSALWEQIHTCAKQSFPHLFDASGNCVNPQFAFKVVDGDSTVPDTKGIAPCKREGFPGHWILRLNSGFPPKMYAKGGGTQLTTPESIKCGYFVRVDGAVKSNESANRPGVHLNLRRVEFQAFGVEITLGPQPKEIFGGQPTESALPAGASTTPITAAAAAPGPGNPAAVDPGPGPGPGPGADLGPGAAPGPGNPGADLGPGNPAAAAPGADLGPGNSAAWSHGAAVQPARDFLNPVERRLDPQGNAFTRQEFLDAGWDDAAIDALPLAQ